MFGMNTLKQDKTAEGRYNMTQTLLRLPTFVGTKIIDLTLVMTDMRAFSLIRNVSAKY